jgi:hypothetical protein
MWTYQSYLDIVKEGMEADTVFLLRHDVDISIKKAVEMAEVEAEKSLHSTYYILLTSPFYNTFSTDNIQRIKTIRELGMGIGLHYDPSVCDLNNDRMTGDIVQQLRLLETYIGKLEGLSVTFHRPVMGRDVDTDLIGQLDDMEIYCPNYDDRFKYISDSGHNWRENPYDTVEEFKMVHLNTHPIWYSHVGLEMEECLHDISLDKDADRLVQRFINQVKMYRERVR